MAAALAAPRDRAARLHRESIIINCHDHMRRARDFEDMRTGGVTAKIYKPLADGIYWDDSNRRVFPPDPFDWTGKYLELISGVERLEGKVLIARTVADIERAKETGQVAAIFGNEGSLPLGGDLRRLENLYTRGLRELAPFWPAGNHTSHILEPDGGLTQFARKLIAAANEMGIVLDSSHLAGGPAFGQMVQESRKPLIHTHGAPRYPRTRKLLEGDLEDDQIRAVSGSGGVIGLHFCTYIKNPNGWNWQPTLDDLLDHVEHLRRVGGIACIGIGADHFPYNRRPVRKPFDRVGNNEIEDRDWSRTFVEGLENISAMPRFTEGLVQRGFSDDEIVSILGGNVLRVLKEVWK